MDINQIINDIKEVPASQPIPKAKISYIPLISISGLSLLSFGGIVLLKSRNTANTPMPNTTKPSQNHPKPTQVPKSIQHYLLASQQYFSKAIEEKDEKIKIELVNQSILAASDAIKEFPDDYRGYHQRGRIYQSLIESQPQLIDQTISDFNIANKLNENSAEISRDLATIYAKKGDAQNTIAYLIQTISNEPTKAQNFYDLAKIQQQAGYFSDALTTYNQLISLVTDPTQKLTIESEKKSLEAIVAANPNIEKNKTTIQITPIDENPKLDAPTIQASIAAKGLIIAAPEIEKKIEIANQTDSNSLSGESIIPTNQLSIVIQNSNLTDNSQIYVTAISGDNTKTLKVLSKTKTSFTVGFDSPSSQDTTFKWWIIK